MGRDERRLIKALQQHHVTLMEVRMASIILACNGIEDALKYVSGLTSTAPDQANVPLEAAEYVYLEDLTNGTFFSEMPGR